MGVWIFKVLLYVHDLNLILREGFAGLGMWSVLVMQSEQYVTYRRKNCREWKLTTVDPQ